MDCNKFNENMSYYIDGILNDSEKKEFEIHLANCVDCKNKYNEMVNIIQSLNDIEEVPLPDDYDEILREKLEKERDNNRKKSNWTKYLSIAASVAIITFSVHAFNSAQKVDNIAQENIDIKEEIISNNKEKIDEEISISINEEPKAVEDKNLNKEKEIVKESNAKQNKDYKRNEQEANEDKKDTNIALFEAEEPKINNEEIESLSIEDEISDKIKTKDKEQSKNDLNQIALLQDSVEPAVFRSNIDLNKNEERVVTIDEIVTIDLPQSKGTEYTLICNDENNIVELISESIEKRDNNDIHTWKFKALKEGKLTIQFKQHKEDNIDEVYGIYKYNINVSIK